MSSSEASSTLSQSEPNGNTKSVWPHQVYRWCFTLKYEACPDPEKLSQLIQEFCKFWVFSEEEGKDGYHHWQGVFSLKSKERFHTVKNMFPNTVHLEPCKDWYASIKYCSKSDSHLSGPYTQDYVFVKTITDLRPWQDLVIANMSKDDDRAIWWYWDSCGNTGKTSLAKYLVVKYNAIYLTNGKSSDLAYCISANPKIVVFDFTRSIEGHLNYSILEQLKNGLLFSSKYGSCMKVFQSPIVICFANFQPERTAMSEDRWRVIDTEVVGLSYDCN